MAAPNAEFRGVVTFMFRASPDDKDNFACMRTIDMRGGLEVDNTTLHPQDPFLPEVAFLCTDKPVETPGTKNSSRTVKASKAARGPGAGQPKRKKTTRRADDGGSAKTNVTGVNHSKRHTRTRSVIAGNCGGTNGKRDKRPWASKNGNSGEPGISNPTTAIGGSAATKPAGPRGTPPTTGAAGREIHTTGPSRGTNVRLRLDETEVRDDMKNGDQGTTHDRDGHKVIFGRDLDDVGKRYLEETTTHHLDTTAVRTSLGVEVTTDAILPVVVRAVLPVVSRAASQPTAATNRAADGNEYDERAQNDVDEGVELIENDMIEPGEEDGTSNEDEENIDENGGTRDLHEGASRNWNYRPSNRKLGHLRRHGWIV
ncbi:hypothetical protein P3T76_007390 [Phytophthora citrophthora]|uniref:Uncharacterized protein n=1 Tax=Phytophthora citrophthora TaxID=4793 RepID=A0AAD9GN84_9STRA|nr:hypothetical protein P3T76_007390 [Phytophthora citrophthora]